MPFHRINQTCSQAAAAPGVGYASGISPSCCSCALFTLGPFDPSPALALSVVVTGVALFTVGAWKSRLAKTSAIVGGVQIAGIGMACAVVAFLLGTVVPASLGLHPIASG